MLEDLNFHNISKARIIIISLLNFLCYDYVVGLSTRCLAYVCAKGAQFSMIKLKNYCGTRICDKTNTAMKLYTSLLTRVVI